jgi:hypothetical protein
MRRNLVVAAVALVIAGGCGRLGTGLPSCRIPTDDPNAATVLTLQAVPDAEYTPCINVLQVGWEDVDFAVESGRASLTFHHDLEPFLEVSLTPSCDVDGALEVPSGVDDVRRYENVFQVVDAIRVTIVPDGERPRIYALNLAAELEGTHIDDRPVVFNVDEDIDFSARSRVNRAFFTDQYVWIITDLDVDEQTLELRATPGGESAHGLSVHEALEQMAHMSDEVQYRGHWYLVFEGGCITYDFDVEGALARSIAEDAEATIGLFSGDDLRQAARNAGFDLG